MPSPPSRRRQCLHLEYWELLGTLCLSDHKRDQFSNLIIKLQPMLEDNTLCKVLGGCKFLFCLWPILKDNATHQSLEIFLLLVKDFEKKYGIIDFMFFPLIKGWSSESSSSCREISDLKLYIFMEDWTIEHFSAKIVLYGEVHVFCGGKFSQ